MTISPSFAALTLFPMGTFKNKYMPYCISQNTKNGCFYFLNSDILIIDLILSDSVS